MIDTAMNCKVLVMSSEKWMTADEAAEAAGVTPGTWTGYVSRGQAPEPTRFDPKTGRRLWARASVEFWLANRPGRGARGTKRAKQRAAERAKEQ